MMTRYVMHKMLSCSRALMHNCLSLSPVGDLPVACTRAESRPFLSAWHNDKLGSVAYHAAGVGKLDAKVKVQTGFIQGGPWEVPKHLAPRGGAPEN